MSCSRMVQAAYGSQSLPGYRWPNSHAGLGWHAFAPETSNRLNPATTFLWVDRGAFFYDDWFGKRIKVERGGNFSRTGFHRFTVNFVCQPFARQ